MGVAFLPDGRQARPYAADNLLKVWDVSTGKEVRSIGGKHGSLWVLAVSPDGRRALCYEPNPRPEPGGVCHVWDVESGQRDRGTRIEPTNHGIVAFAFKPGGRQAVSADERRPTDSWDLPSGKAVPLIPGGEEEVKTFFSPDGRWALTWSHRDEWKLSMRDLTTKKVVWHRPLERFTDLDLVFTPDGSRVLVGAKGKREMINCATGKTVLTLEPHPARPGVGAFTPDGKSILLGGGFTGRFRWGPGGSVTDTHTLLLWDAQTGRLLRTLTMPPDREPEK
jgi:WD40 repeat protein